MGIVKWMNKIKESVKNKYFKHKKILDLLVSLLFFILCLITYEIGFFNSSGKIDLDFYSLLSSSPLFVLFSILGMRIINPSTYKSLKKFFTNDRAISNIVALATFVTALGTIYAGYSTRKAINDQLFWNYYKEIKEITSKVDKLNDLNFQTEIAEIINDDKIKNVFRNNLSAYTQGWITDIKQPLELNHPDDFKKLFFQINLIVKNLYQHDFYGHQPEELAILLSFHLMSEYGTISYSELHRYDDSFKSLKQLLATTIFDKNTFTNAYENYYIPHLKFIKNSEWTYKNILKANEHKYSKKTLREMYWRLEGFLTYYMNYYGDSKEWSRKTPIPKKYSTLEKREDRLIMKIINFGEENKLIKEEKLSKDELANALENALENAKTSILNKVPVGEKLKGGV